MKIKSDIMTRMIFFLLLSELVGCDSSYIEMRLVSPKNRRDSLRKFDRFGSLEKIRLRSYRTLGARKLPLISNSRMHTNEADPAIKNDPQISNPLHLNRIVLNRENPTLERISDLRVGVRLIGERQRESSAKLRNVITMEHLSNMDITTEESPKKVNHLARGYNRNDRRVTNGMENRFSLQIRKNRLREKLRSRRSIILSKYNTERRTTEMRVRNADSTKIPLVIANEASETRKSLINSRKEHTVKVSNRDANRKYVNRQRSDKREIVQAKSRYNTRNTRNSKLFVSFPEQEYHIKRFELRRERNSLVSRRELQIPDGERIRSEETRQGRRNARSRVVRDKNIEETTQNRRNGRGFRGRMGERNTMDQRRENVVQVKVPFLNQRIQFGYQRTSNPRKSITRNEQLFMYRVTKVSRQRHFSQTDRETSLSDLKYNRVSRVLNGFDKSIRQHREGPIIREIRRTEDRPRFAIFNRARRLTMRMGSSAMERNTLNRERQGLPYHLDTQRHTSVKETNKQEAIFSVRENNKAIQNGERHTQRTSVRKLAMRDTKTRNSDNSLGSLSPSRFSIQVGDRRVDETSQQSRNAVVRNRRVGDRMRSITRRLRVQPMSVIRLVVAQFLDQVAQAINFNRFHRNSRITDSPNRVRFSNHLKDKGHSPQLNVREIFYSRRIAVRSQREMVDKYRDILNKRFRSVNENYNPVRIRLNKRSDFSDGDVKNTRNIHERAVRRNHRNKEVGVNYQTYAKIESFATIRFKNYSRIARSTPDVRFNRRLLSKSPRIIVSYASKSYGFIKSNSLEELYKPENSYMKDPVKRMPFSDNSMRLYASQRAEHHGLVNPTTLKSYNQAGWTLHEYIFKKKNSMVSFVFNVILGLAVIVAISEDINKGFTSQLKNQLKHSIFKYLKV